MLTTKYRLRYKSEYFSRPKGKWAK